MGGELVDVAIIGAGPYGLSLAAYLRDTDRTFRIFGESMEFWTQNMPPGMRLKSEGFASDLYDPEQRFPLKVYCAGAGIPYADVGLPVKIATFVAYGQAFQRRFVPQLEAVQIASISKCARGFELTTMAGERFQAQRVVVATGIANFGFVPSELAGLPDSHLTHSSQHGDVGRFRDRRVAVLGAGASAIDVAVALKNAGADVELIARVEAIRFHDPPQEPRAYIERIKAPRSGLGTGWRSRLCTDIPLVFHALPRSLRFRAVARHLGPAPCWFTREEIDGRVPLHLGMSVTGSQMDGKHLRLALHARNGAPKCLEVDHVVAATGYRVAVSRLGFLEPGLRSLVRVADDTPVLNRYFESSVPGLYFVGAAAANSFGPLLRFAFGAKFAAARVSRHLLSAT